MKRKAGAFMLLAALGGGCVTTEKTAPGPQPFGTAMQAQPASGFVGPWGQPVATRPATPDAKSGVMPAGATAKPGDGVMQAGGMGKPTGGVVQALATSKPGDPSGVKQTNWEAKTGHGVPLPPPVPGAVAAIGALPGGAPNKFPCGRTSVRFAGPAGMQVSWFAASPETRGGFARNMVEAPGRYNFVQGAVYRLKLSNIPNQPQLELYPTLEVVPASSKTATFLAHSAVPVGFTQEDFDQVSAGNFVTKVVYLPDPAFQDLAVAGPEEVVSSRLEPGVDPVAEAMRRGSILLIIRMGNIDLEAPNTPPLDAPPVNPFMGMPLRTPDGMPAPGMAPPPTPGGMMMPPPSPTGMMMPPGATLPVAPGGTMPGRAAVTSSAEPPVMKLPDAGMTMPVGGKFNASADAMYMKVK
jgi:hypothetical protein